MATTDLAFVPKFGYPWTIGGALRVRAERPACPGRRRHRLETAETAARPSRPPLAIGINGGLSVAGRRQQTAETAARLGRSPLAIGINGGLSVTPAVISR